MSTPNLKSSMAFPNDEHIARVELEIVSDRGPEIIIKKFHEKLYE